MSLFVPDNLREPRSRIIDSSILRPRDELQLIGRYFLATIGVLDSHNPSDSVPLSLAEVLGLTPPSLPDHHHVLVRIEGHEDVISTGMLVGVGEPQELLFGHITIDQEADQNFRSRLRGLMKLLERADHIGLIYVSDDEHLSRTPQGIAYIDSDGGLLR